MPFQAPIAFESFQHFQKPISATSTATQRTSDQTLRPILAISLQTRQAQNEGIRSLLQIRKPTITCIHHKNKMLSTNSPTTWPPNPLANPCLPTTRPVRKSSAPHLRGLPRKRPVQHFKRKPGTIPEQTWTVTRAATNTGHCPRQNILAGPDTHASILEHHKPKHTTPAQTESAASPPITHRPVHRGVKKGTSNCQNGIWEWPQESNHNLTKIPRHQRIKRPHSGLNQPLSSIIAA